MDERTARKLRAAAEHERKVADQAAEAVERLEAKAERDAARLQEAITEARAEADTATRRAEEASRLLAEAGLAPLDPGGPVARAGAGAAEGRGK